MRDLGARIIKIELPRSGDVTRHSTPLVEREDGGRYDVSADQRSGFFAMANTGKESIALDLKDDADREVLEALISKADVLVENFSPGVMAGLGYDWDSVHAKWPSIVMASISGFGQTGPLSPNRALDTVIQGMSGLMSVTGFADREPVRVGASISDMMSGMRKQLSPPSHLRECLHCRREKSQRSRCAQTRPTASRRRCSRVSATARGATSTCPCSTSPSR